MSLQSPRELEAAREKLRQLEECYEQERRSPDGDARVHELTVQSLQRTINQFKEEIARFESRMGVVAQP